MSNAKPGDLVLLISDDRKRYLIKLVAGGEWHTHRGILDHDEIIDQPVGRTVYTQTGKPFLVLEPSTHDLIGKIPRVTQIIFPEDAAHIVMRLNCFPGRRVVECGTGSGALTLALARAVMPTGHVFSYEMRPKMIAIAQRNLKRAGLLDHVTLNQQDALEGFGIENADACFLDLRHPWELLDQTREALKPGGFFGSILPTANQVSMLVDLLANKGFVEIAVEELLLRSYKPIPQRLRPMDRMVAHTGYLVFARAISVDDAEQWSYRDRKHGIPRPPSDEANIKEAIGSDDRG